MSPAGLLRAPARPRRAGQAPLFEPARREGVDRAPAPGERPGSGGGRLTLERRLRSVWEDLAAAGAAECPVCRGPLRRAGEAARCEGCGSQLT